jgi:hypothetical protein
VKRRWGYLVGFVAAAAILVPLATAGAQAPATVGGEVPTVEGSAPPGGTVNCTTGATLDPPNGPPGTVVTVTTTFSGNCDDVNPIFLAGMTCTGQYLVTGQEAMSFPMTVDEMTGNATGTFNAPVTEPDPPVVDAVEPVTVTVTCQVGTTQVSPPAEGNVGTTYVYPGVNFDLELFADPDGDQPTLIDNDPEPNVDDGGVVSGTPPFTG